MKGQRLLAGLLLAGGAGFGVSGCQTTPTIVKASATPAAGPIQDRSAINGTSDLIGVRKPEVTSQGHDKLNIAVTDTDVVLSSDRDLHDYDEVTYIIELIDGPSYNLQFTSAQDLDDFKVAVSVKRLYKGDYVVKAYGDKELEPFDSGTFKMLDEGL